MKNKIYKRGNLIRIELYDITKNVVAIALADLDDLKLISVHRWYRHRQGYVCTHTPNSKKRKITFMHQMVTGASYIDHISGNRLDNRKKNLRKVTHSQNKMNRPAPSNNKSGVKGVFWDEDRSMWRATLLMRGRFHLQKRFRLKKDAIAQRKEWEKTHFREHNYGTMGEVQ